MRRLTIRRNGSQEQTGSFTNLALQSIQATTIFPSRVIKHGKKGRILLIKSPAFYFYIGWIAVSVLFVTQAMRIPVYDEFLSSGRFLPLVLSFLMVVFFLYTSVSAL